jgi:hypothetical protein
MASEWVWNAGVSYADKVRVQTAKEAEDADVLDKISRGIPPPNATQFQRYQAAAIAAAGPPFNNGTWIRLFPHPAAAEMLRYGYVHHYSSLLDKIGTGFTIAAGALVGFGAVSAFAGAASSIGSSISSAASSVESTVAGAVESTGIGGVSLSGIGSTLGAISKGAALLAAVKSKLGGGTKSSSSAAPHESTSYSSSSPPSSPWLPWVLVAAAGVLGYTLLERRQ